jgi:uroporphyrinogen-III synthase
MRRLIVLRPEPGAAATVERAQALGLEAVAMPLFRIVPLEWQSPEPGGFDALLLTSANALRHGGEGLQRLRGLKTYAVGEATAEAARDAGFDIAATGDSGVERLLGSLEADRRLLHLCGEDRTELDARQAITAVPVYRAEALDAPAGFDSVAGSTAAVHSPRAARRLRQLAEERGVDREQVRVAAISPAAAEAAGAGWQCCEAAEAPSDEALLALAARLCDKPDPE